METMGRWLEVDAEYGMSMESRLKARHSEMISSLEAGRKHWDCLLVSKGIFSKHDKTTVEPCFKGFQGTNIFFLW